MISSELSLFLLLLICSNNPDLNAQNLIGFSTEYNDTYREWRIFPEDEDIDLGSLSLSWPYNSSWDDWEYIIENKVGDIHPKWINDKHHWEIIDGPYVVSIKPQWRNDYSIWRISCDEYDFTFESKYRNIADEWQLTTKTNGTFHIYTEYEGDPRDWIIEDYLSSEVPVALKMAMIFVVIQYSTPHK